MAPTEPGRNGRVLVVNDTAWSATILARMLAEDGHEVDTAQNGAMALAKIQERRYDLIVWDMRGPEDPVLCDGLERLEPDRVPRIVRITGTTSQPPSTCS